MNPISTSLPALLAIAASLFGTAQPAGAAPCRLAAHPAQFRISSGDAVVIDVVAGFPTDAYAFAAAEFEMAASVPTWMSATAGAIAGADVFNIGVKQDHLPFDGIVADPSNPLAVWSGELRPDVAGPALVSIEPQPIDFAYYPSSKTPSSVQCDAGASRSFVFVDPAPIGVMGAVAPGAGVGLDVMPGGSFTATPGDDQAILIGLLLPAVQKVREAATMRPAWAAAPPSAVGIEVLTGPAEGVANPWMGSIAVNFTQIAAAPGYNLSLTADPDVAGEVCLPCGALLKCLLLTPDVQIPLERLPDGVTVKQIESGAPNAGTLIELLVVMTYDEPVMIELPGVYVGETTEVQIRASSPKLFQAALKGAVVSAAGLDAPIQFDLIPACEGDIDADLDVDSEDLNRLLAAFGLTAGGDLNADGATDSDDLNILLGAFGDVCS